LTSPFFVSSLILFSTQLFPLFSGARVSFTYPTLFFHFPPSFMRNSLFCPGPVALLIFFPIHVESPVRMPLATLPPDTVSSDLYSQAPPAMSFLRTEGVVVMNRLPLQLGGPAVFISRCVPLPFYGIVYRAPPRPSRFWRSPKILAAFLLAARKALAWLRRLRTVIFLQGGSFFCPFPCLW